MPKPELFVWQKSEIGLIVGFDGHRPTCHGRRGGVRGREPVGACGDAGMAHVPEHRRTRRALGLAGGRVDMEGGAGTSTRRGRWRSAAIGTPELWREVGSGCGGPIQDSLGDEIPKANGVPKRDASEEPQSKRNGARPPMGPVAMQGPLGRVRGPRGLLGLPNHTGSLRDGSGWRQAFAGGL